MVGIGHVAAVLFLLFVHAISVPQLIKLFQGFDTELPGITVAVIMNGQLVSRWIVLLGPLSLLLLAGDLALFYKLHQFHRLAGIGLALLVSAMLAFVTYFVHMGVRMPIIKWMNDLQ